LNSFVDLFIINEISRSVDGYKLSSFLHKYKGNKLQAGPISDFGLSTYNADYCGADPTAGWTYNQPIVSIRKYTVTGELVHTRTPIGRFHDKVEVSGLSSGLYLIQVNNGIPEKVDCTINLA
jgi:hypothetical protein